MALLGELREAHLDDFEARGAWLCKPVCLPPSPSARFPPCSPTSLPQPCRSHGCLGFGTARLSSAPR
jgi:hypothetical protein